MAKGINQGDLYGVFRPSGQDHILVKPFSTGLKIK